MIEIALLQEPNQRIGLQLADGTNVNITIKTAKDATLMSVSTDFEELINSALCIPNGFVNTYGKVYGYFFWQCQDNEYPNYEKFNGLHTLYYLTPEEYTEVTGE